jgi:hypothetical protein
VANRLAAWLPLASEAVTAATAVKHLQAAQKWLAEAATDLRNDRFAPIADEVLGNWRLLRHDSNVDVAAVAFEGAGNRRRVLLDVAVDGVGSAAFGVMSQGELQALALSLFLPRATLPESPFRFVVIDDPVQSMDPARVEGLARVLERTARDRQVVVFTHDDRLFEAVRRLGVDARVLEVTRQPGSVVHLRAVLDPVARYLDDAQALVSTDELPGHVAARVVPAFCRFALESAFTEVTRRRLLGRGVRHTDVEQRILAARTLAQKAALALFDDADRGGEVNDQLRRRFGPGLATAYQRARRGAHDGADQRHLRNLVDDTRRLARELQRR